MKYCLIAAGFLAAPPAALSAQDVPALGFDFAVSVPQEEPVQEPEAAPEEAENYPPVMEFIYWNSRVEAGVLLTRFDNDLDIESDVGYYARYRLNLPDIWTLTVTYRHYSFENSGLAGIKHEDLLLRALMIGGGVRLPVVEGIGLEASASAGVMWLESRHAGMDDAAGLILSGEAALTVRLHEMMRLKLGTAVDLARTDFHQDSAEGVTGLSGFLALEIGG